MHPKHPLILSLCTASLLALSACSQKSEDSAASAPQAAADSAAPASTARQADSTVPDIPPDVAPGVAFTFDYAFSLPAKAIAQVQQRHAAACQRLGPAHCRVNGMSYDQPRAGEVAASTRFLLSPDLAHRFGSEGITAVEEAEGRLDKAAINGEDAGSAIDLSQDTSAALSGEIARIETRLRAKGLDAAERQELQARLSGLQDQQRGEVRLRRDKEAAIASTPVHFSYSSESLIAANGNPLGKAAAASWGSAGWAVSALLIAAGYALPWLLLAALAVLLFRSPDVRRLLRRPAASDGPTPDGPTA